MGFFQGFFCGKTAQKIRRKNPHPKSAQAITKSAKKSAPQNPRKKIRTQKSAPKNPHQKSAWKIHTHMSVQKSQPPPSVKQTPANQYQRRLWTACPTWRLIYDAWRRPRQFYTDHHILISRCWQQKTPKKSAQKIRYATLGHSQ